jgi:hypothetical protein
MQNFTRKREGKVVILLYCCFSGLSHRSVKKNNATTFRELVVLPSSGETAYSVGSDRRV